MESFRTGPKLLTLRRIVALFISISSEPQDVREMASFFADMQRQERRKGGPVSRSSADTHKLIRYQRNGIARLSRAIRQG